MEEVVLCDETDPVSSPMKARRAGECGLCGVSAAVAGRGRLGRWPIAECHQLNSSASPSGVRCRNLPRLRRREVPFLFLTAYGSDTIPLRYIAPPRRSKPLQPALLVGQLDMMWTVRSVACVAPASILLSTI